MSLKSPGAARAMQIIVPFAAIVVGNVAGIGWLSLVGAIALGWVIASALLRGPRMENFPPLRGLWPPLAAAIVTGLVLIPVAMWNPPTYVMVPVLLVGVIAIYLALGYLMWWFIRLNSA